MATIVKSLSTKGVEGYVVDVETKTISGQPMISIVGLGDTAVKEARERVEAAILDGRFIFPQMKIVVNLAPSDLKKSGSHFDLPIALSLLMEANQFRIKRKEDFAFIGELSLNARLRGCKGVLSMIIAAKSAGIGSIIVPRENLEEASLVQGIKVYGFERLRDVVEFLEKDKEYVVPEDKGFEAESAMGDNVDFSEVQGQELLVEYIVAAAAGGHNMLMIGAPGCGKSMIAKRIPTILPQMSEEEALEVTKIYSVAGLLKGNDSLVRKRPFRAPHHNASTNSLIGGGNRATPGEISLAHNGVLFLDEIAEFSKRTLDALRQPMEDKVVTVSRVKETNSYPANFMLVAAMNPCPCGYYGSDRCSCTDYEVLKYRQRLSGPILERMDLQKYVQPVDFMDLSSYTSKLSSAQLRERVEAARMVQRRRFEGIEGVNCNAQMGQALVKEFCVLDSQCRDLLQRVYDRYKYSARTFHKFLKVSRTFADLEGSVDIRKKDVMAAVMSRDLEKEKVNMAVVS
ncbi:magnesium chelatase family protein [Dethiosulfatibacter aminovorans DSM 17477]|uniref:Magnesium chelatase family protein n=1 Tax=Dethiosulfatibacter aminovorans DSM 17477 TaxID=1121476 RepID=A0A1M6MS20_9FIRM|nr:YifB family Mg chelatase-like AAA ATPase [Dethiosulfatibacter aminovorans]SHJ86206.1 magnesium chelatase family protein [Dethiosulfatibacter aminovorans DSM 17477]